MKIMEKQKAKEMIESFRNLSRDGRFTAKECALLEVDRHIEDEYMYDNGNPEPVRFYKKVKAELLKS